MGNVGGVVVMAAGGLLTAYLWDRTWRGRRRISCMTGMMVAMAAGMMVGLIAGVVAAVMLPGALWPPTLVGMLAGILAGAVLGAPVSLMAVLDGGLAGLMGGMMGAMLAVMAPQALTGIGLFLMTVYLLAAGLLMVVLRQEAGDDLPIIRPIEAWLLILLAFAMGVSLPAAAVIPVPDAQVTTLEVMASDFAFDRKEVRIAKGQPVRLVLRNGGSAEHDLVIQGLEATVTKPGMHGQGLHAHTPPGRTDSLEFVPLAPGNYVAICTIPGHKEAGMKVAIQVVDQL